MTTTYTTIAEICQKEKATPHKAPTANDLQRQQPACPDVVVCVCTGPSASTGEKHADGGCRKVNLDYTANKLRELIADPVTNNDVVRICRLLCDYLHEIGDTGYRLKHLPATMRILEFLALKAREVPDYQIHLDRMLVLCDRPPLLERTSDILTSACVLEQYFTVLGYLLAILPTPPEVLTVHEALHRLLLDAGPTNIAAVKLESLRAAMESSRLPITLAELVEASYPDIYPKLLELVLLLSSVSDTCCYRMLEAGILNPVLIRMDLAYATQPWCRSPPDVMLEGDSYSDDTMVLIMNVLWSLMRSILPPKKLPAHLLNLPAPSRCAMWYCHPMHSHSRGLRYAFNRQIRCSQCSRYSLKMRNEMASLILAGLIALPSWPLTSSGISDDVICLLVAAEAGTANILAEHVKFGNTNDDLFFRKTLLLIVSYLTEINACIYILLTRGVMQTVLEIVNPSVDSFKPLWSPSQFWQLAECAMYVLSRLAPKIPEEFVKYNGTGRLLLMIEWSLNEHFDAELVLHCTKTICSIVKCKDALILADFRSHDMSTSLIKLIFHIVALDELTLRHQRILTLLVIILETVVKSNTIARQLYGEHSIRIAMKLLNRCLYRKLDEYRVDQRLLLAIGSYIWECIVWSSDILPIFLECGGLYMMLDTIEIATFPVRVLYLGAITDMCDGSMCAPYLCTWRGVDKKKGLMALLAMAWREEEIRLGVRRLPDGSMEDAELPQMGAKQWVDTYHSKLLSNHSPTLDDMIGSVRSKIYSIRKNMANEAEKFEIVEKHYKRLCDELSLEDRITMSFADLYFRLKIGQVWTEIGRYFDQAGVNPLAMDGQIMFLMIQRYRSWGMFMKERQLKMGKAVNEADIVEEKDEFAKIHDATLAPALDAFDEIDYIRRTTDRSYMLRKKYKQRSEVEAALSFPLYMDAEHCHRTYQDKINVTAVFGQDHTIYNTQTDDSSFPKIRAPLVSPISSDDDQFIESSSASSIKSYELTGHCESEEIVNKPRRVTTIEDDE